MNKDQQSYVYFARLGRVDAWQLGVSTQPNKAVRTFGGPQGLAVLYSTTGDRALKGQIGFYLSRFRVKSGWYQLTADEIRVLLRELKEKGREMLATVRPLSVERRRRVKSVKASLSSCDVLGGEL